MAQYPPAAHWQPHRQPPGQPPAVRRRLSRDALIILAVVVAVFAAGAFGVGFVLVGGAGDEAGPGPGAIEPTGSASPAVLVTPAGAVAANWGEVATVRGSDRAGDKSATIEVTLSEPAVMTEIELSNGRVRSPDRDAFVVIPAGTIEGVTGVYQYNMNHFQLIPAAELARWDGSDGPHQPTLVTGMEPSLRSGTISEGNRIVGSLVFDVFDTALDDHVLVLRSLLVPDGPAAAYWPLDAVS